MSNVRPRQLESTANPYANGSILEGWTIAVTSDGATITGTVTPDSGTDLTFRFSNGLTVVDYTIPKTVILTAGSATVPQENWIYVLKTDPTTLVLSTSSFPATEYASIARITVLNATRVQGGTGVIKHHNYTDHIEETNSQGHVAITNSWIRSQWATWLSGVAPTITGSGTATVTYAVTSGQILQLHQHTFPAFTDPASIFIINEATTPYSIATNLSTDLLVDSTGASLTNRYYNLIIWASIAEEGSVDSILVVNLPSGSYATLSQAQADASTFTDFGIPASDKGVGFLVQKILMRNQTDTTFTVHGTLDLRGQFPNTVAGTSIAQATEFPDSTFMVFNNADNSKEVQLGVNLVTTATTRTMTVPDKNGTIAMLSDITAALPVKRVFSIIATAGQTVFTLPSAPPTPTLTTAFRNGNKAIYGTNFTVSGSTLTWITPTLIAGEEISGFYNDTGLSIEKTIVQKTASATLTGAESSFLIVVNSASAVTITVPETSTESLPGGTFWEIYNEGSGDVTIAKEGTDVLNGNTLVASQTWAEVTKTAAGTPNTYDINLGTAIITYNIEHIITGSIANGTYRFSRTRFDGTIINIFGILDSGTADLDLEISGVAVTHTTLSLSSTETNQVPSANNVFDNSDYIDYVITNAAASDRLVLTLECTGRF